MPYHVLTAEAAIHVGIINEKWEDVTPHGATEDVIAAAAKSSHSSFKAAEYAALSSGLDCWVVGPDGKAEWIPQ